MNLEVKKIDTANAHLSAKPSIEDLEKRYDKIAQKIAQKVKIDGFRRGKVPLSLVKTRYQAQIEQDAQEEMIQFKTPLYTLHFKRNISVYLTSTYDF
ncbi:hypothetical protein BTM277_08740 [Helicobacter pylori]